MHELLIMSVSGKRQFTLDSDGPWRIGRKVPCEIVIKDKYISAIHAELARVSSGFQLRRMKDLNPVKVSGKSIESTILKVGDSFTIGKTQFTLLDNEKNTGSAEFEYDTQALLSGPAADSRSEQGTAAQFLRELYKISENLSNDDLNQSLLRLVCDRLGAERGLLARTTEQKGLRVIASYGFGKRLDISDLISNTVLSKVVEELQTILIGNVSEDPSLSAKQSVQNNSICAVACAPFLNSDSSLAGIIYIDNQHRSGKFQPNDAEFLVWAGHFYRLLSENILATARLKVQLEELKRAAKNDVQFIAESRQILEVLEQAKKIAPSDKGVLILGESGSGKECIADFIHRQSTRAKNPLVAYNCAAIPHNLFESEMFGHVKGAFSGATSDRKGAFLEAIGGTLFLDEIGEMSYEHQAKLLRAIQEKKIRPVGGSRDIPADIRIICATNCDLRQAIKAKTFREDLYFRVATFTIEVPPLRQRREDILPLARHFAHQVSNGGRVLTPEAESHLLNYEWPGNARELRSVVEAAAFMAAGSSIQSSDLNMIDRSHHGTLLGQFPQTLLEVEYQHIRSIVQKYSGNLTHAARALGIARSTLVVKLKEYGLYQPGETTGFR